MVPNESTPLYGSMGITDEYETGLFLKKRARPLQLLFGDQHYHASSFALLQGF